jgi:hypothetical protein
MGYGVNRDLFAGSAKLRFGWNGCFGLADP